MKPVLRPVRVRLGFGFGFGSGSGSGSGSGLGSGSGSGSGVGSGSGPGSGYQLRQLFRLRGSHLGQPRVDALSARCVEVRVEQVERRRLCGRVESVWDSREDLLVKQKPKLSREGFSGLIGRSGCLQRMHRIHREEGLPPEGCIGFTWRRGCRQRDA